MRSKFAVLEVPLMGLQSIYRLRKERPKGAIAILDEAGPKSFVFEANPEAIQSGVTLGMAPAQALARCPNLKMLARSSEAEEPIHRLLIRLGQTLSPRVEQTQFGLITVDLSGISEDGIDNKSHVLIDRLSELRIHARIGLSLTPDHARWAALFAKPFLKVQSLDAFLKRVPIEVARPSGRIADTINSWGIKTMHQLYALPREAVGQRLGQAGLELWDRIAGRNPTVLNLVNTKPIFKRSQSFEYRIESIETLLFILKRFIEELAIELHASEMAAHTFELRLKLDNDTIEKKCIEVPEASSRVFTLFRILETGLENFQTQDAIVAVELKLGVTQAIGRQGDLFAVRMKDSAAFAETADRVAAIVGPQRSGSPRRLNSWRPDAFRVTTLKAQIPETAESKAEELPVNEFGLPLSRFRPPSMVRVETIQEKPDRLLSGQYRGRVVALKGPWLHSGDWWGPDSWQRIEWDIEIEGGGLFRIFQENDNWYLEGIYG